MKHPRKEGKVIIDKDTKFIKKLLNKNPIIFDGKIHEDKDCNIVITKIRKYKNTWCYGENKKFVYEIDIKVVFNKESFLYRYWARETRRNNRRMRSYTMEKLFTEELCYFNINDFCISKISYE